MIHGIDHDSGLSPGRGISVGFDLDTGRCNVLTITLPALALAVAILALAMALAETLAIRSELMKLTFKYGPLGPARAI